MTVPPPTVSIIIVTVNTPQTTHACLTSVVQHTTVPFELLVVNNSRARPIRTALARFPQARVVQNSRNIGYAAAANQGARMARSPALCFLNSDTLVPPGWLERLLAAARRPKVGAVGPSANGREYGWEHPWPPPHLPMTPATIALIDAAVQRWEGARCETVPWLSGFCLLIPRAVMARVGVLDERFFLGWDDVDYSLRLRERGYRLLRVRGVFVYHQWGGSARPERRAQLGQQAADQFIAKWRMRAIPPLRGSSLGGYPAQRRALLDAVASRP